MNARLSTPVSALRTLAGGLPAWWSRALAAAFIVVGVAVPFLFGGNGGFMNATIIAFAYAVMSLGTEHRGRHRRPARPRLRRVLRAGRVLGRLVRL